MISLCSEKRVLTAGWRVTRPRLLPHAGAMSRGTVGAVLSQMLRLPRRLPLFKVRAVHREPHLTCLHRRNQTTVCGGAAESACLRPRPSRTPGRLGFLNKQSGGATLIDRRWWFTRPQQLCMGRGRRDNGAVLKATGTYLKAKTNDPVSLTKTRRCVLLSGHRRFVLTGKKYIICQFPGN